MAVYYCSSSKCARDVIFTTFFKTGAFYEILLAKDAFIVQFLIFSCAYIFIPLQNDNALYHFHFLIMLSSL
jgi:hypothetical protein